MNTSRTHWRLSDKGSEDKDELGSEEIHEVAFQEKDLSFYHNETSSLPLWTKKGVRE